MLVGHCLKGKHHGKIRLTKLDWLSHNNTKMGQKMTCDRPLHYCGLQGNTIYGVISTGLDQYHAGFI